MASRRLIAARRAIPQQIECRSRVIGLEQIGANRLPEAGIVKLQGDIIARLLPAAFPACSNLRADLGAIVIAEMDAIVRRVLRISLVDRNQNQFRIERERAMRPERPVLVRLNVPICAMGCPCCSGLKERFSVSARATGNGRHLPHRSTAEARGRRWSFWGSVQSSGHRGCPGRPSS